ncbi:MAG: hypothetical protein LBR36_03745, partial [Bacteroidales bacterium]|nr:hypothetical protein [Bacteroidales bacterium]
MKDKAGLKKQDYDKFIDKIADKYNNAWLTTEINFATASAQNAARWIDFKSEENIIKNLTYQTMGDNVVRYE